MQLVPETSSTLEVRWILPGPLESGVLDWFARFPAKTEAREDAYLLQPALEGLSVKIRGDSMLEVKVHSGSPGVLDLPRSARGRLDSWQKWSFPFGPQSGHATGSTDWVRMRKTRRITSFSHGAVTPALPDGLDQEANCAAELTELRIGEESWWTLGLEASGAAEALRGEVEAAVATLFAKEMPGGLELRVEASGPYSEWLARQWNPTGSRT